MLLGGGIMRSVLYISDESGGTGVVILILVCVDVPGTRSKLVPPP